MLSTENPPSSQLKISSSSSDDNNKHQFEVDLLKPGIGDDNNPLPNFSIRDYVFNTRGKDIKNHWPFSQKILQLCLEHGVKDVLPPFQTLDSVRQRNSSIVKGATENISNSIVKLSGLSDHHLSLSPSNVVQKLAFDINNIKSTSSEEDREYPSTTTSLSCSDVNKVPKDTRKPAKKCRLIVKLSSIVGPNSNEDLSFNACVVSETMASKVCPVCKTFTSSSNTTLNAHIDQCLSGESTIKGTMDSKVIKHRIKPRKKRLMVDIYATALCCTLEDLDRRNGTKWASNLCFPPQDSEVPDEEKNNTYSSINIEDNNEEGAVYFDSNGRKLRILSKFSDLQSNSNAKDDCGRKLSRRDKGSKLVSSKKKKYLVQRHKLPKCPPCGQRNYSPRLNDCPKANNCREREISHEGDEKEDSAQALKACDQMKSSDYGMIKQWVGSKRTGLKKKIKNLRVKSNLPLQGDMSIKRTSDLGVSISSDNYSLLSFESHKRKENVSFDSHDECMEEPCLRKRVGFSSFESEHSHGKKNHLMLSKCNFKQSKNDGPSVRRHRTDPSRSNTEMRSISPTTNSDISFVNSRMSQHHMVSSRVKGFGFLQKTSSFHASVSESKKDLGRKHLEFKKPGLRYMQRSDEGTVGQTANYRQDNVVKKLGKNAAQIEKASIERSQVLKIRKRRAELVDNGKGGDTVSKDSEKHINFIVGGDEFVREPICKISGGEAFIGFSESLYSRFPALTGPDVELVSQHYMTAYEGHSPPDRVLSAGEQQMFCSDKVGEDLVTSNTHVGLEFNASEGQGSYLDDVDPIPIPGPPGSFLPSPGRMASEELQGNSSLTTCRIHSSEDEHEFTDMDSSDSPISTTSLVSNSIAGRFKNSHPCCCCRKEGVLQNGSLNYQEESQLIRKETATTSLPPLPSQKKQMSHDLDINIYSFNLRPETVPKKEPTQEPKNLVMNTQKQVVSHSSEAKFPTCGGAPSPSACNPVLRLMGKNLMVLNKDENPSTNDHPIRHSCAENVVPSSNFQNQHSSFNHASSDGPSIFDNTQTWMSMQQFNFTSSDLASRSSSVRTTENEASLATQGENMEARALGYDSRPVMFNQTRWCYPNSGSQKVLNENTRVPPSNEMNVDLVNWKRTPPQGHLSSSLYISPGFS